MTVGMVFGLLMRRMSSLPSLNYSPLFLNCFPHFLLDHRHFCHFSVWRFRAERAGILSAVWCNVVSSPQFRDF